jgi:hypothetical protein
MTSDQQMVAWAVNVARECRMFMQEPDTDAARAAGRAVWLDQTARKIDKTVEHARAAIASFEETAAWCRLAAGLLRGLDVPESIHAPVGEDPADTARWEKWRVS